MKIRFIPNVVLLCVMLGSFLFQCQIPEPPPGSEEAKVNIFFKSPTAQISELSLTDTVGNPDTICLVIYLTQFMDSVRLKILKDNVEEYSFFAVEKKIIVDTVHYGLLFKTPGKRIVKAVGYIDGQPNSEVIGTIEIVDKSVSSTGDLTSPVIRLIAPEKDSSSISSSSYQLTVSCKDESEIDSVHIVMGATRFDVSKSSDTLYSAVITGLVASQMNTVSIRAWDASPKVNTCSLNVHIKYDPAMIDNVPPLISFVSPSKDTIINIDSCVVTVKCSDQSGVANVTMNIGTDTVIAVRGADNLFTATLKKLAAGQTSTVTVTATDSAAVPITGRKNIQIKFDNVNVKPAITAFSFASPAVTGTVDEATKIIGVTVPYGTNVTALIPAFTTTGSSVKVGTLVQVSGTTANNFSSPVIYTVTAADGSTQDYTVTVTVSANTTKALTAFSIASPAVTGTVNETAKTIAVTVPYGTNVTALIPAFTTTGSLVKVGTLAQVSGTTANNFSSPVIYTVTAADGSTQDYTVTVTVSANTAKALTAFSIASPAVTGTVNETAKTIAVTVPYGTNVTALIPAFTTTGSSVKVGTTVQVSGTTANNFSSPVIYTVTAADGSTQDYTVTVTVSANTTKALTAFSIASPVVTGTVNETAKTIAVTVPYGTNVTALIPAFTTTGSSVKVGTTVQVSGTTANNFSSPVIYTVTAADGSTQDYSVTVTVSANTAKALTAFSIASPAVTGTVNETAKTIAVTVPYGTNVAALVAAFTTTGSSVKVGTIVQVSGTTANNFSSPVIYTVTAADGSTQEYSVTVTVGVNTAKALTAFSFASPAATGTIDETAKTIAVKVPYGTNVAALVAAFTTTGSSVKVGTTIQTSGTTANNFSSPVTYTVTAADGSTQDYAVTVTVGANTAKALTAFSFASPAATGTIDETAKTITVKVPYGTSVTALVATFATTGSSVKVGTTVQTSGTTANNFSSPVTYTVTAADGSTQDYAVTVTVGANTAKALTAFSIASPAATGTIDETAKTIAVKVPYGTNVAALVAAFTTTGSSVKVGTTIQTSGTTANNFSSPVTYTVTAADGSTQDYSVTVTVGANPAKALTAFSFATPAATGSIDETAKTVSITVPYSTSLTGLVATFTTTGSSVRVGTMAQTSGTTANNFSNPVTYTVVAADGTTQNYVVTVNVRANPAKALTAFNFASPAATGTIDETAKTVSITVPYSASLTGLVATFTTTGSSVRVGTTAQTSGTTANNFSNPVTYTVVAADGTTQNYVVTVTVTLPTYSITYDMNGGGTAAGTHGSGTVPTTSTGHVQGSVVTVSGNTGNLTREGYVWEGWSTTAGGNRVESVTMNSNVRLFARWVIRDASGNPYTEVTIDGQVWMLENLRTTKYNNGDDIDPWFGDRTGVPQYYYASNSSKVGCYYNYYVVADSRGIAPAGWRVPNGYTIPENAKAFASQTGWNESNEPGAVGNNQAANNSSGFNALPAGNYDPGGVVNVGDGALFWTSTDAQQNAAMAWFIWADSPYAYENRWDYNRGLSVRCVREY